MNIVVNINICRVCMNTENGHSLSDDSELKQKFEFTTRLALNLNDNMPTTICSRCVTRLKVAYDFVQLAQQSEKTLKGFLTKINSDFALVTKARPEKATTSSKEEDDDILTYIEQEERVADAQKVENKSVAKKRNIIPTKLATTKAKVAKQISEQCAIEVDNENEPVKEEQQEPQSDEVGFVLYADSNYLEKAEVDAEEPANITENSITFEYETQSIISDVDAVQQEQTQQPETELLQEYEAMLDEEHLKDGVDLVEEQSEQMLEMHLYDNEADAQEDEQQLEAREDDEELEEELEELDQKSNMEAEFLDETQMEIAETKSDTTLNVYPVQCIKSTTLANATPRKRKVQCANTKKTNDKKSSTAALNTRFICEKCNRDFTTKTNLKRHMAEHEGQRRFQCTVCNKSFTQNGSLKQHMLTHTGVKPHVCEICNRGFTQSKSLVFHLRRHTGIKPFHCENCGLLFRQKDGLKAHIMRHHMSRVGNDATTCFICKQVLGNKQTLKMHMKKHINHHNSSTGSGSGSNNSSNVDANTEILLELLDEDLLLSEKTFEHETTAHINNSEIGTSTHIIDVMATSAAEPSRAKKFQCRKCFKCFAIKKNLIRHLSIHEVTVAELFQCKTCQIAFDTNDALIAHRLRVHKEKQDVNAHSCAECPNVSFSTEKELVQHILQHEWTTVEDSEDCVETFEVQNA